MTSLSVTWQVTGVTNQTIELVENYYDNVELLIVRDLKVMAFIFNETENANNKDRIVVDYSLTINKEVHTFRCLL